ncbi:MAG: hypothetical protein PF485_14755 [Bacteroidales bacterium]|jgi:hypothetical protein|nr:hypothetical protein [Bacteroidales bacterium]
MIRILNTYKLYIIHIVVMSVLFTVVKAQDVTVKAELDTSEFLVGDQIGLELEVKQPFNEFVGIPIFKEELNKQVEIIEQSEHDTTLLESGHFIIKKRMLITVFDSGYYVLPPIGFLYYSDTLKSEPIAFKVNGVAVDTSQAIKEIKMPNAAPLSFAEVFPWASGGLGLALLIFMIVYVIRKIKRKEPILGRFKPREPAHIIALRELTRLKDDKLWQHDKIKSYYTILTDIMRMYLWNRYSIRTLERTSEEILDSLKASDFKDKELFDTLKDIFYTSDLVKFAKFKPIADEHEKCMNGAYSFVDRTKLIIVEKPERSVGGDEDAESSKELLKVKEEKLN